MTVAKVRVIGGDDETAGAVIESMANRIAENSGRAASYSSVPRRAARPTTTAT